jgi:hypothetical protein
MKPLHRTSRSHHCLDPAFRAVRQHTLHPRRLPASRPPPKGWFLRRSAGRPHSRTSTRAGRGTKTAGLHLEDAPARPRLCGGGGGRVTPTTLVSESRAASTGSSSPLRRPDQAPPRPRVFDQLLGLPDLDHSCTVLSGDRSPGDGWPTTSRRPAPRAAYARRGSRTRAPDPAAGPDQWITWSSSRGCPARLSGSVPEHLLVLAGVSEVRQA